MRFADPQCLWLLLFLPLIAGYLALFRQNDLPGFRFSSLNRLKSITTKTSLKAEVMAPGLLRIAALFLIIVALARPQRGLRSEELTTKATDILLCLDASRSMLTVDFKPQNRFEVAKNVIAEFIKGREHDRMGLVVFAEHAMTQCPLTLDKNALLDILNMLHVGMIPPDRTAIGVGLATCVNRLKNSQAKSKAIILLTDGASNAGSIDPITAAKTAASFNIKVYTIGAGSPEGGLMPVEDPLLGPRYVPVQSDIDEEVLRKIADHTKGKYFRAKSEGALKEIFTEIDVLEKTDIKIKEFVDYKELYLWFLVASTGLLIIELTLQKTLFRTLP